MEQHPEHISDANVSMRYWDPTASEGLRGDPWLDAEGRHIWSKTRICLFRVIDSQWFDTFMAIIIVCNMGLIVMETDLEAQCYPRYSNNTSLCPYLDGKSQPWIKTTNLLLLVGYTIEIVLRAYVERDAYLKNMWNILDASIVVLGWLGTVMKGFLNVSFLRFFRIARLARALRVFIAFRELYLLLAGFLSALRTIGWGTAMMFGMLLLWGILLVEFVHPVNSLIDFEDCERCARGFGDVFSAVLTLFQQVIAGDSWGSISVPLLEEAPWTAVFVVTATITISLGLMNLILAVIVERAAEARERDMEEKLKRKQKEQDNHKNLLYKICLEMDIDGSGTLDHLELLEAYDNHEHFRKTLQIMDIQRDELKSVFKVLDKDGSGDVDYREFCNELHMIKNRDTRTMLTFLKLSVSELNEHVTLSTRQCGQNFEESKAVQAKMLASIDERLGRLESEGATLRTSLARREGGGGGGGGADAWGIFDPFKGGPVAPPKPREEKAVSTEVVLGELQGLGQSTRELANLKGLIVKRLEGQVGTLTTQAGALATIGNTMKCGGGGTATAAAAAAAAEQAGGGQGLGGVFELPEAQLAKVSAMVEKLRENMDRELAALLKDVDKKLDSGEAALARNSELLESLSKDLGCSLPAADRNGRIESKASSFRRGNASRPRESSSACSCITVARPDPDRMPQSLQPTRV